MNTLLPLPRYEHIPVSRAALEPPRRKRLGFPSPSPETDAVAHGEGLQTSLDDIRREFTAAAETRPREFDPSLIFKISLANSVSEDEWRKCDLDVLSTQPREAIVVFANDVELTAFQRRLDEYKKGIPEGQKTASYDNLFSSIEGFQGWSAEDRMGPLLVREDIVPAKVYLLDVEVWFVNRDLARNYLEQVQSFVTNRGGEYLDDFASFSLAVARVRVTGELLLQLLEQTPIYQVDLPPEPTLRYSEVFQLSAEDFPAVSQPSPDSPSVCTIDSGVFRGHPMLGPAIGETLPVPERLGTALDAHGHGSFVAGLALYGNLEESIERRLFTPELILHAARVTNDENRFDDETIIVRQMNDAIRYFHQNYRCRVFNISLGDERYVYDGTQPPAWAAILDELARELDIIIVVPTGNYSDCMTLKEQAIEDYPNYLFGEDCRLISPAMAANVLTVGAIAPRGVSILAARYPNDPAYRSIAGVDQPSPFTRRGPGVSKAIKPELCDYGGNLVYHALSNAVMPPQQGVPVFSTHHDLTRLFAVNAGTSFAAPKVAHLAARVLQFYPNASANLIRALLANSATIPDAALDLFRSTDDAVSDLGYDNENALNLCGYGRPDLARAVYSTEGRVTLYSEDQLELDKFHVYAVPVPDVFCNTRGDRHITVTLAFDPPTRRTRKDYCGVRMEFDLIRGKTIDEVVDIYQAFDNREEEVRLSPLSARCSMYPTISTRRSSTLQKAVHVIRRRPDPCYGDTYWLVVRCLSTKWTNSSSTPPQRYAIVVTLEHREEPWLGLYNVIQQRLREPARVRIPS